MFLFQKKKMEVATSFHSHFILLLYKVKPMGCHLCMCTCYFFFYVRNPSLILNTHMSSTILKTSLYMCEIIIFRCPNLHQAYKKKVNIMIVLSFHINEFSTQYYGRRIIKKGLVWKLDFFWDCKHVMLV